MKTRKEKRAKSNKNLKPVKPGEILNPKGGKPGPKLKVMLRKILQGKMTIKEAGRKKNLTKIEIVLLKLVTDAMDEKNTASERIRAAEAIMNRLEGKPEQPLSAVKDTEVHLTLIGKETEL